MIISHKYKFIFIKTRKTAGTSIETYLSRYCDKKDIITPVGNEPETEVHKSRNWKGFFNPFPELFLFDGNVKSLAKPFKDFLFREKFYNHIPAYRVKARVPQKIWDSYYKFCVERNPWDKTISHYSMVNQRSNDGLTFDEYISKKNFCFNFPLYMDHKHQRIIVDKVLKHENLYSELGEVFADIGIPFDGVLNVRAKSHYRKDKRPYQEVFSGEYKKHRDVIADAFKKEIELHGYSFDGGSD